MDQFQFKLNQRDEQTNVIHLINHTELKSEIMPTDSNAIPMGENQLQDQEASLSHHVEPQDDSA